MGPLRESLSLLLFVVVSTITPGGATTLATASGAHFGYRRSIPYMAGIAAGLASMAAATAAGLGGIVLAWPALQVGMKALGSLYLLWLAVQIARSGAPKAPGAAAGAAKPTGFASGVWMLWHNPKGWTMTLSAAASFATLAHGPAQVAMLLGVAFGVAALVSLSAWCVAGLALARLLRTDAHWRVLNIVLAGLLVVSIATIWVPASA